MSTPADRLFGAALRINGSEDEELYSCLQTITVDEDLDRGASFNLRLALLRDETGGWPHLDNEDLRPWNRITILVTFGDHADVLMDGYISHVQPAGSARDRAVMVDLAGVDAAYVMNLDEKTVVWTADELGGEEPTYEAIARQIIESYGLRPMLPPDAGGAATGPLPATTQRATDYRFLRELARRKGYEFYVRGADAHFHAPDLDAEPQKLIAFHFGEETNCSELQIFLDGTQPTEAAMTRIDPMTGEPRTAQAAAAEQQPLGARDLGELRGFGVPQRRVLVRRQAAASQAQMDDYVQGLLRRRGWWIKATGTLDGLRYGQVLRSKKPVVIKGFGTSFNGVYYVRKVRHELAARSYTMKFEAYRNRLGQTGDEDFTGELPELVALPAAAGAGADADLVAVREDGAQVAPA